MLTYWFVVVQASSIESMDKQLVHASRVYTDYISVPYNNLYHLWTNTERNRTHGDSACWHSYSPQGRHGGQCYLCSAWFRYCSLLSSQVFHDPWSMNHADLSEKWFVLLPYSKHMWVWAPMESDGLLALRLNAISACARILGELFTLCWL